jgi:hypothetical protein
LKPNAHEYGEKELTEWYVERDLLGVAGERIIGSEQTQDETVARILAEALPSRARPGNDPHPNLSRTPAAGARLTASRAALE